MTDYTYTTIDYQGPYRTFLYDINNEGQIIGQYTIYGVNFLYSIITVRSRHSTT